MRRFLVAVLVIVPVLVPTSVTADPPTFGEFVFTARDDGLCEFPFEVTLAGKGPHHVLRNQEREFFTGPTHVDLRNLDTGATAALESPGSIVLDFEDGIGTWRGAVVGTFAAIPLIEFRGQSSFRLDDFVLVRDVGRDKIVNPCALLSSLGPTVPRATPAPWPPVADTLGAIEYAGLLPVAFGPQRHIDVHVDVFVDGAAVEVPAGIGIIEPVEVGGLTGSALGAAAPAHTHTPDGVVHMETDRLSPTLTLGHFFDIWQVRLTDDCLGSYCTGGGRELRVYVNGEQWTDSPRSVVFQHFDEVAVVFGVPGVPAVIPATFDFPPHPH